MRFRGSSSSPPALPSPPLLWRLNLVDKTVQRLQRFTGRGYILVVVPNRGLALVHSSLNQTAKLLQRVGLQFDVGIADTDAELLWQPMCRFSLDPGKDWRTPDPYGGDTLGILLRLNEKRLRIERRFIVTQGFAQGGLRRQCKPPAGLPAALLGSTHDLERFLQWGVDVYVDAIVDRIGVSHIVAVTEPSAEDGLVHLCEDGLGLTDGFLVIQ